MKKVLSMVLVWVMVLTLIPLGVVTASAETLSGTTGDCTWTLVDGVLTISGNGKTATYGEYDGSLEDTPADYSAERPWGKNDLLKEIIILDGVTEIGRILFIGSNNLTSVKIADSVEIIRHGAFWGCENLKTLYLGSGIKKIELEAFYTNHLTEESNLTDIYYNGTIFEKENISFDKHSTFIRSDVRWHCITASDLRKESDGNWYYYENGQKTKITSLVQYKGIWFYIENGVWRKDLTTLVSHKGKDYYIKEGKWVQDTTIVKHNGELFYVKAGKVAQDFSGKVKIDNKTYKIKDGKVVSDSKSETTSKTNNTNKPAASNEIEAETESDISSEQETSAQQQLTKNESGNDNSKEKTYVRVIIILVIIIAVLLLCGGAIVLYLKRKRN